MRPALDRPRVPRSLDPHAHYIRSVGRMIAAAGRRVAEGDPEHLSDLLELQAALDAAIAQGVRGLRSAGFTWANLGAATGTSKEAAFMKWAALCGGDDVGAEAV